MGYTHYWKKPYEVKVKIYKNIVDDFKTIVIELETIGVKLAGWDGKGTPDINYDDVRFNGIENCGHLKNDSISIPWPSEDAGGVAGYLDNIKEGNKHWFAGTLLSKRCCDGNCSYETFQFTRKEPSDHSDPPEKDSKYTNCCKTAFRPYDLAVNCFLIIAKHHLKDSLIVKSDGNSPQWFDGKLICQTKLDYGFDFKLDS